jgi:hypothetical protein
VDWAFLPLRVVRAGRPALESVSTRIEARVTTGNAFR